MSDMAAPEMSVRDNEDYGALSPSFYEQVAMGGPFLSVVVEGKDSRIVSANNTFQQFTGYSKEELSGKLFSDLMDNYELDRLKHQFNAVQDNSFSCYSFVIYRLVNKEGVSQPFYIYASPVNAKGGNIELFSLLMLPDNFRWGMPFTSYETKELFLEHLDSEAFGTFEWIIDVDKVFWSEGVYRIYEVEISKKEITQLFAREFMHPDDVLKFRDITIEAIEQSKDLNIEYRIITAKGNTKIIHSIARSIKDKNGIPIKFVGSIKDVTRQRHIENSLTNMVEELKRSNRELEEFAYAASHDMQEPLRKITTFSDRLSEKYGNQLEGEGAMYLNRMVASAENMRLLINGLLEFSKIAKTPAPYELLNLNTTLQQVVTELELKIEETRTKISWEHLPTIIAVPSQMKQLFLNLIGNAIKFHKLDEVPSIRITSGALTEDEMIKSGLSRRKAYYKVAVSDNGIGFEPEYSERIFQVFQRLHGKSEYPGSGIGLAICKKITEYHGGVIYAESRGADGATFTLILPEAQ
jgi:PAS domain S-box-containing protein